jgi:histidine triad (HIT) family protein
MDPNCIFCKIITRDSPSTTVFRDELVVAFQDIHPVAPTHILIVPIKHIASVNDLVDEDEALIGHMFMVARDLAQEKGIADRGYRLILNTGPDARQAVFHLHLHLIGGRQMRYPMG